MGKRLGLVVGINQYQDTQLQPLHCAENDALAFAQWLVNVKGGQWSPPDVQHVQGIHATRELIESLISQVCLTIAEPADLVLIYFAGYAFVDERGDGYLACTNTHTQDTTTALHLPSLAHAIMARSRAAHIVILLDCAQAGAVWRTRRSSPYDYKPLLNATLPYLAQQQTNRLFFCTCRAHEQAAEVGERGLGLFMYQCIVGLCGPAFDSALGAHTLQQLHTHLTSALPEQQRPHLFGQERAPLLLTGTLPPLQVPPNAADNPSPFRAATPYRQHVPPTTATATPPVQPSAPPWTPPMAPIATADRYRQPRPAAPAEPQSAARSFLLGLLVQGAGVTAGILGSILLILMHSSQVPGLALQSIGLALLCVNSARGSYRHGLLRFALTLLTSLAAAALLALALKPFYSRLLAVLRDHPSLLIPLLFIILWLALTAILPLPLALGGLLLGRLKPKAVTPPHPRQAAPIRP